MRASTQRALTWAVAEAQRRGGTVQAIIAWALTPPQFGAEVRADREDVARQALDQAIAVARRGYPDVAVAAEVAGGPAAEVLTGAATDAEHCIRAAVCPVVVVPVPHLVMPPAEPTGRTRRADHHRHLLTPRRGTR